MSKFRRVACVWRGSAAAATLPMAWQAEFLDFVRKEPSLSGSDRYSRSFFTQSVISAMPTTPYLVGGQLRFSISLEPHQIATAKRERVHAVCAQDKQPASGRCPRGTRPSAVRTSNARGIGRALLRPPQRLATIDYPAMSLGPRCAIATSTATIRAIANVSGTGGVKSRPHHLRFFSKKPKAI